MGRKQKTKHEGSTADPCFYQSVEFHEMLPEDLKFAPEIRVEVRPPKNKRAKVFTAVEKKRQHEPTTRP